MWRVLLKLAAFGVLRVSEPGRLYPQVRHLYVNSIPQRSMNRDGLVNGEKNGEGPQGTREDVCEKGPRAPWETLFLY